MRIINSVSSGYSSVMMAIKIREWYPEAEIVNIMANTSREREESLVFMDKCDNHYGLDLIWVEADINPNHGEGTRHIVKTFDTLTRDGSLFEKGIVKYGIPSAVNKWCNRELKLNPIHSYAKNELNWGIFGKDYYTSIGIRADEIDRISAKWKEFKILYPLA
jgi:3'-phosphoadenosine 5'-phosphosulfate sulfotransferase (PAPS reductase)/FAD synthetase